VESVEKVYIIGVGEDAAEGLTPAALEKIQQADVLLGSERALDLAGDSEGERVVIGHDLDAAVESIRSIASKKIVMLATGDPLFYGTARYLCEKLGKDRFEVVPHVSSMQLAFARVKESWDEAYLANLANRNLDAVVEKIRTAEKVGLFTTPENTPAQVAQALLAKKIDYFHAYVCENLGSPDECVTHADLSEVAETQFSPLNVMVLVRKPDTPDRPIEKVGRRLFGNPDEAFLQSKPKRGLLTPAEVRSIALAQLDLGQTSIVWDVGAGSGSMSVEAAQLATGGTVYAIEMDPEDSGLIVENAQRFGVDNIVPVLGKAPEAWADLPDPDAVFVGGAGRGVIGLCEQAFPRLKPGGRLVVNVGSIKSFSMVHEALLKLAGDAKTWMINISYGTDQLLRMRFESLSPTFLVAVVKP